MSEQAAALEPVIKTYLGEGCYKELINASRSGVFHRVHCGEFAYKINEHIGGSVKRLTRRTMMNGIKSFERHFLLKELLTS